MGTAGDTDEPPWNVNLCFHGIGVPQRELEPDEHLYWIETERFEEMLSVVARHPWICVTFDDGNQSDVAIALPALARRGLRAEFFLLAGRLDQPGSLSRDDVRALAAAGMKVGTHGMHHRPWPSLGRDDLHEELATAATLLGELAGKPVHRAACPFGSYNRRVLGELRRHGYSRVYTVDGGPATPGQWLAPRTTIRNTDGPADIERLARDPHGRRSAALLRGAKGIVKRWR